MTQGPDYVVIRTGPSSHKVTARILGPGHRQYLFRVASGAGCLGAVPIALVLGALSGQFEASPALSAVALLFAASWVLAFLPASIPLLLADPQSGPPFH